MSSIHCPLLAAIIAANLCGGAALAQSVALPKHQSALTDYQAYRDEKPANWRDVNDTMAVLGGHNAHLRTVETKVTAAGTVLEIDRAANRVRIDGDAIKALGWPAGIAFWQLTPPSLADQVKPGERVAFTLEKDGDAYRISGFARNAPPAPPTPPAAQAAKPAKPADPHAGHNMATPAPAPSPAKPAAPKAPHDMQNMKGMK